MWREISQDMPTFPSLIRWTAGAALFALAWRLVPGELGPLNVHRLMLAGLAFFAGALLLWPAIFWLATKPLFLLVDQVFSPGGRLERPTLNLKLPAYYVEQGRYEEALEEYLKILKHYPGEAEAYERAIWLLAAVFKRDAEASRLLRQAERRGLVLDGDIVRLVRWRSR